MIFKKTTMPISIQWIVLIVTINIPANVISIPESFYNQSGLSFIVSIQQSLRHVCTGVLIADDVVLTTGHCLAGINEIDSLSIQPNYDDEIHSPSDPKKRYRARNIMIHPDMDIVDHDVGLIKLMKPVEHVNGIEAISVYGAVGDDELTDEDYLIMAAWGFTKSKKFTDKLYLTRIRFMAQKKCTKRFKMTSEEVRRLLCGTSYHTKICRGDGGAPVFRFDPNNGSKQIVSLLVYSSANCTTEKFLSVKISHNYDWITNEVDLLQPTSITPFPPDK